MLVNNVVVQAKGEERIKVVQVRDLPKRSQASVTGMSVWPGG